MDYTILDDGSTASLPGNQVRFGASGRLRIDESALEAALGWQLKPEGLCQGEVCVPVRDRGELVDETGVDLERFAEVLGRPLVVDSEAGVIGLGRSAPVQVASMATLEAPDFELPDLAGERHTLAAHRGKKVLLIAYASW